MLIAMRGTTPTGTAYTEDRPEFHAHHAQYGETCVWMPGIQLAYDENGKCTTEFTFSQLRELKRSEIAHARWTAEVGGTTIGGTPIRTDRESQSMITGAALKAMQDANYTCAWKGLEGWIELSAPQILAIADAVREHVQACFDHERTLNALVDAAETAADLESIRW